MTSNCFHCIELNAHSLVLMLIYLKENQLTHLFMPQLCNSQHCETFYRKIRSLTTVHSTVVNFSVKEILDRISRIQLLSEISNDSNSDSGFNYPMSLCSGKLVNQNNSNDKFPSKNDIIETLLKSKKKAIEIALKIGLIKKNAREKESTCVCPVLPYTIIKRKKKTFVDESYLNNSDIFHDLHIILIASKIKNYAQKFKEDSLLETSLYVEVYVNNSRYVFKKTSLCFVLSKKSYKCSSDRRYRVRNPMKSDNVKRFKVKSFKVPPISKRFVKRKKN